MSNLSELLPAGSGAKVAEFVASGTLASGQAVALRSDGKVEAVSAVAQAVGSPVVFETAGVTETGSAYDANAQKVVIAYRDTGNSNYGTAVVGTVSGTSISFGTPVVFETAVARYSAVVYDANAQKIVIAYKDADNSNRSTAIVGTVSGTSISFGTAVVFDATGGSNDFAATYDANAQKVVIAYQTSSDNGIAIVGTVSGTSISFGSPTQLENSRNTNLGITYDSSAQKVVVAYKDNDGSNYGTAVVGTVSGTSISFGTPTVYVTETANYNSIVYDTVAQKVVIVFQNNGNSNYGTAVVGTVSGTSISFGTAVVFHSATTNWPSAAYDTNAKKVVVSYNNNNTQGEVIVGTVSGTSISFSSAVQFEPAAPQNITIVYDSTAQKVVTSYEDSGNSSYGTSFVFQAASSSNTDFVGITNEAISNSATGEVAVQGGVITNTNLNVATAITAGSKVVFDDGGATTGIALAYDPDTAKVVNVFCTTNVQGIVGTVSGTSISYGSASSANSNSSSDAQVAYDTVNNKIVAVYKEGFNDARVVIGTVSGTAISWGTPVVFASINAATPNVAFDTNAGKVLIVYKDQANNNYGKAVVGTVSGTSISIGSPVTFMNANANKIELVYDANAQKSVLVVQDASNNIGVAYVATISGTSVSFGSPTNFLSSALTANALAITYNSTDNKVIVGFSKGSDNKGYLTTGTVSGTSISFAGETEFSGSTTTNYISLSYKASGNVLGMTYNIGGATTVKFNAAVISGTSFSFGTEQELTAGATDITATTVDLASGNFVGSYGDGSNNSDGTTNVISVATTLATGTDYYVQDDGTLSTTVSSVPAGRALSSTSILLEG